jgi:hypothetical protein
MRLRTTIGKIASIAVKLLLFGWLMVAFSLLSSLLIRFDLGITAIGLACNYLAITSNGGRMPVYPGTLEQEPVIG